MSETSIPDRHARIAFDLLKALTTTHDTSPTGVFGVLTRQPPRPGAALEAVWQCVHQHADIPQAIECAAAAALTVALWHVIESDVGRLCDAIEPRRRERALRARVLAEREDARARRPVVERPPAPPPVRDPLDPNADLLVDASELAADVKDESVGTPESNEPEPARVGGRRVFDVDA